MSIAHGVDDEARTPVAPLTRVDACCQSTFDVHRTILCVRNQVCLIFVLEPKDARGWGSRLAVCASISKQTKQ